MLLIEECVTERNPCERLEFLPHLPSGVFLCPFVTLFFTYFKKTSGGSKREKQMPQFLSMIYLLYRTYAVSG